MLIPTVKPCSLSNTTKIQKVASKIGEFIPNKLSRTFEMNQVGTIERAPLVLLSLLFVLGARFVKARDAHERREVLTRDAITILVAMMGVPIVKNWMQRGVDKLSKIPVATETNKKFSLNDFGFENVKNWYSKADKMPEKALSIAKNIQKKGGDVSKAFSMLGEDGMKHLKTILNGKEFNSKNIIEALDKAFKAKSGKQHVAFEALTKTLSNPKNGLALAAQRLKAIPALASIVFITSLLGWGISAFNIKFTRKKLKNLEHTNLEPQLSDNQKQLIDSFLNSQRKV